MAIKKERRRRMRVPLGGSVELIGGGKQLTATALDIGAEGMSVVASLKVRTGSEVSVEFCLPGSEGRFLIQATVMRAEKKPDGFLLGLRFRTEGWVMAHVQEFVRTQLARLARNRKKKAPQETVSTKAPAPTPQRQKRRPESQEDFKPDKMAIDLDRSEVARLFKEALKKKD